jgi:hypothetical protein
VTKCVLNEEKTEKKITHIFNSFQLDIRSRKAALGTFYIKKSFSNVSAEKKAAFFLARERVSERDEVH